MAWIVCKKCWPASKRTAGYIPAFLVPDLSEGLEGWLTNLQRPELLKTELNPGYSFLTWTKKHETKTPDQHNQNGTDGTNFKQGQWSVSTYWPNWG